jgi:ketosteroid isomerase-like protein
MSDQNVNIVQQAYADFKKGNIEGVLQVLADNIQWELPQIKGVPFSGKRAGRSAVGNFFAIVNENQESLIFEPREFIANNEQVVATGFYRWRVKTTGKQFEAEFAHIFTIREGKVTKFVEYMDTAAVLAAYQQ